MISRQPHGSPYQFNRLKLRHIASIESISFAIATLFAAVGGPPANRKTPPGILQCQQSSLMADIFLAYMEVS